MNIFKLFVITSLFFVFSCNSNKSESEMKELWSKAQTKGEIIDRSGTKFNSGMDMDLALRDAENRLQSGGGLFGKGGLSFSGVLNNNENKEIASQSVSMAINPYLWRGTLETIDFMPISSADSVGGMIITDWYSTPGNQNERCKLNILISGKTLKTENLKVTSFCQNFKNQIWVSKEVDKEKNVKIENAILNKAKKLKIQSS